MGRNSAARAARLLALSCVLAAGAAAAQTVAPASSPPDDFVESRVGPDAATLGGVSLLNPAPAATRSFIDEAATNGVAFQPFGFLATAPRSANLFGDLWGLRPALGKYGVTLSVVETSEMLGNVSGGIRRGFDYEGLTTATAQLDSQRAFGFNGGLLNVSALQIHGRNLSADNLDMLQTASGIEADRATRIWEVWYQQKLGDAWDIRVGQQSLDQEFMTSQNASYFVNTMMGWPMLPSADLPGGGPAYPLSAVGARLRWQASDSIALLGGLYSGNPAPSGDGNPQQTDRYGLSFPFNSGALAIAELQFVYPGSGMVINAGEPEPLARTYKIGVWYDSGSFADLRYNALGQPLGDPANSRTPRLHSGDYALYAVADQMIWRSGEADRNVNVFLRPMFTPLQDRNLVSLSLNAGLTMHEPIVGRDDDTAGLGFGYVRVSGGARGLDADTAASSPGAYAPSRGGETFVEATYQYQVMPWWQIVPDIQYVVNPGAGLADPGNPGRKIGNAWVLGLRTNIAF